MNILLTSYFPLGIGGAEVSMLSLAKALKLRKHKVIIASTGFYAGFKNYEYAKIRCFPFFFLKNLYFKRCLKRIIKKESIDVVHSNDNLTAVGAIEAAKECGINSVTHYRDYWFACPKGSCLTPNGDECGLCNIKSIIHCCKLYRLPWDLYKLSYLERIRKKLSKADIKIAISNTVSKKLQLAGIVGNVNVLPNSVSVSDFASIQAAHKFPKCKIALLYVGALSYHKGFKVLLDAVKPILEKRKDVCLFVAGKGPLVGVLPAFPNIHYCAEVGYKDMPYLYASSDIVIFPSIWQEPFGRVVIEAMAAGKPVVASAVGGVVDIIKHKKNGLLVKKDDVESLREGIQYLIDNPKFRAKLGATAKKYAMNYSEEKIVIRLEQIYANANGS